MTPAATTFDTLYQHSDDPWHLQSRWYERRKRQLTLAALPRERYRRAFEPGCAGGELTALLAARCDTLLAADLHERAVALTLARISHTAEASHVRVEQRTIPHEWPNETFDLIVISEIAYYLSDTELHALALRIGATLDVDGTLLACHWRRPFDAALQSTEALHAHFSAHCGLTRIVHHDEADLLLDVWTRDGCSVAQLEGIA